jgi:predicted permease
MRLPFWRRRRRRERELDEEIRAHLEMAARERMERGEPPEEARQAARREFGNVGLVKETSREMWGWSWLEDLFRDVRYGWRMLRKSPGFAAIAVAALALGIGANTAIFSLIDAVLLQPLPVRNPQGLVLLEWQAHHSPKFDSYDSFGDCSTQPGNGANPNGCSFSYPFFQQVEQKASAFQGVTAFGGSGRLNLSGNGPASIVRGQFVSGGFFRTLGVDAAIGRTIQPEDDRVSAEPVVVLSYAYWQSAFGGSGEAVGRTIRLNNVAFTIVGVADAKFPGVTPGNLYDLWIPLAEAPKLRVSWGTEPENAANWWLVILGRLRPGTTAGQAQAMVNVLFRNEMLRGTKPLSEAKDDPSVAVFPAQEGLSGERENLELPLFVLMLAVGVVLLIACANVAGLMLARSATRQREVALRLALGAGKGRVARQLLSESVLLSLAGGALGCYVAYGSLQAIIALVSSEMEQPFPYPVTPDWRILVFTAAISIFTGVLFGLAPALRSTRVDLTPALKGSAEGGAATPEHGRKWLSLGNALVVAQVALAVVLLAGAGLLVRTLQNLKGVDPGFDTRRVLLFGINPTLLDYKPAQMQNLYRVLRTRLEAVPGVISVSYSSSALLSGSLWTSEVRVEGRADKSKVDVDMLGAGPEFFETMRIPLLAGRTFDSADFAQAAEAAPAAAKKTTNDKAAAAAAATHVLVNRAFARNYLAGRNPLGVGLSKGDSGTTKGGASAADGKPRVPDWTIVGVVADTKYNSLRRDVHPTVYVPLTSGGAYFALRTAVDPASLIPTVRETAAGVDSNLPLYNVRTETGQIERLLFDERLISQLSGLFGVLALVLACIGLYGLLSYEVAQRTREIGIRMALGAQRRDVHRLVMGRGIALTAVGAVLGLGGAFGVTRFLERMLYGVKAVDPVTFAAVGALLLVVAVGACYVPARRAMRVDPMTALRFE